MKDIKLKYFQLNYSRTYFKDKNQRIIAVVCKKKKFKPLVSRTEKVHVVEASINRITWLDSFVKKFFSSLYLLVVRQYR